MSRLDLNQYEQARQNLEQTALEFARDILEPASNTFSASNELRIHLTRKISFTAGWVREKALRVVSEVEAILYSSGWMPKSTLRKTGDRFLMTVHLIRMTEEEFGGLNRYDTVGWTHLNADTFWKQQADRWEGMYKMAANDLQVFHARAVEILKERDAARKEAYELRRLYTLASLKFKALKKKLEQTAR